jgi:hypothetical protein
LWSWDRLFRHSVAFLGRDVRRVGKDTQGLSDVGPGGSAAEIAQSAPVAEASGDQANQQLVDGQCSCSASAAACARVCSFLKKAIMIGYH